MCKTALQIARDGALREFMHHLPKFSGKGACWEWKKYRNPKGYGVICFDLMKFPVHRMSFEHFKGMIPKGMVVMHTCDNPPCFNPEHLYLGSHADNMHDMKVKGRARRKKS